MVDDRLSLEGPGKSGNRGSSEVADSGWRLAEFAHEVRNPLTSILSLLEAWESEPGVDFDVFGPRVQREVQRVLGMMQEVMDSGKTTHSSRPWTLIAPHRLVEAAVAHSRNEAETHGVRLRVELGDQVGLIEGDFVALERALHNLLGNALQHSPLGGTVTVATHPSRDRVVFSVEDTGPGFRDRDLQQVFEPFYSRRHGGSGMGLAIVHRVVSEHGGTVAATNRRGGGGVVYLSLPLSSEVPKEARR